MLGPFAERLGTLVLAMGPALPIGVVLLSLGARGFSPALARVAVTMGALAGFASLAAAVPAAILAAAAGGAVLKAGISAFAVAAIPEETAKFAILVTIVLRHEESRGRPDASLAGGWLGLGFALCENLFYVTGSADAWTTAWLRAATAVPMHVALGLVMGSLLAGGGGARRRVAALGLPVALHGSYDFPLELMKGAGPAPSPIQGWMLLFVAVLLATRWAMLALSVPALSGSSSGGSGEARDALCDAHARLAETAGRLTAALLGVGAEALVLGVALGAVVLGPEVILFAPLAVLPRGLAELWQRGASARGT